MPRTSFSLQIGALKFNQQSLLTVLSGLFLLGLLVGIACAIHIDNPGLSIAVTLPLYAAFIIPTLIIIKGIRKADEINTP